MRNIISTRGDWAVAVVLFFAGCASVQPAAQPPPNSAEVVLAANEDQVRSAILTVLAEDGYSFEEGEQKGEPIRTGYREEIRGENWRLIRQIGVDFWVASAAPTFPGENWLLIKRFGVGRSKVLVMLSPEDESATRLRIEVTHEGKYSGVAPLFSSWKPHDPPIQQSAENIVRLVKNALGLL